MSSDEQEYGHGEAMADEFSMGSSNDYCPQRMSALGPTNHLKIISDAAKSGTLPNSTLRSVLLTIEDPAFAAVAATSTTFIDDETSPVDSLFDSPTQSMAQSIVKEIKRKEREALEHANEDDSPGTPTNASNSLSLSEGREYFDDEIEDQPGLLFLNKSKGPADPPSGPVSITATENSSSTLIVSTPKRSKINNYN